MSSHLPREDGDVLTEAIFCPQCKRKYGATNTDREAKLLNCLDTFCLECLRKHVQDVTTSYPWHPVSCQLCQAPIDGSPESIRENPVVSILLKIEAITSDPNAGRRSPCDACAGETSEGRTPDTEVPHAEVYCEECDQKLCAACHTAHGKLRQTKTHKKVVRLGSQDSKTLAKSWKELLPRCPSHSNQPGELYCGTCRAYLCGRCAKEHAERHKVPCRPSVQVVQELRTGLTKQAEEIARMGSEWKAKQEKIKHRKKQFTDDVGAVYEEILQRAEDIHRAVDLHRDELVSQLEKIRVETEEEFEDGLDSAKLDELRSKRFVKFTDLTTTVDLSTLEELRPMVDQKANELKAKRCIDNVQHVALCLTPGSWQETVASSGSNCIGSIDVRRTQPT